MGLLWSAPLGIFLPPYCPTVGPYPSLPVPMGTPYVTVADTATGVPDHDLDSSGEDGTDGRGRSIGN